LTRIVLVRHGQTEWNKEERFRGRVDIDLDEVGLRQAKAVAERLAQWEVAAIYSSPLKRAVATAEAIAGRLSLQMEILGGLNDMHFGVWQGLPIAEARKNYPELFDLWRSSPEQLRIPEGETLDDVQNRVVATLDELVAKHENETIALVTHRVVCKVLLCHVLGLGNSHFWQIAQDTAAINLFEIRGGRTTVSLVNDTCHLRDL